MGLTGSKTLGKSVRPISELLHSSRDPAPSLRSDRANPTQGVGDGRGRYPRSPRDVGDGGCLRPLSTQIDLDPVTNRFGGQVRTPEDTERKGWLVRERRVLRVHREHEKRQFFETGLDGDVVPAHDDQCDTPP